MLHGTSFGDTSGEGPIAPISPAVLVAMYGLSTRAPEYGAPLTALVEQYFCGFSSTERWARKQQRACQRCVSVNGV
jgi:hypothetical protein